MENEAKLKENFSEVAIRLNNTISSVLSETNIKGFERAFQTAKAISVLKTILTEEYMRPIMDLQGNRLGFKTDKDKAGGYPIDIVKNCLIEAVLMGLQPYGNEFNIIAGNMYPTKEGLGSVLANWRGLKYTLICNTPKIQPDNKTAVVNVDMSWTLNGEQDKASIPISVKMDSYTSVDALIGKATRKGRAWLVSKISGIEITDADIEDTTFIDVSQKKEDHEAISEQKAKKRVLKHISESVSLTQLEQVKGEMYDDEVIAAYNEKLKEIKSSKKGGKSSLFDEKGE